MQICTHKAVKIECMQVVHITFHFRTYPPTCALTCGVKVLKDVILSVLFYECETAVNVKEEQGMILFKKKFLRRILGPDRKEVTETTDAKFIILSKYMYFLRCSN